MRLPARFKLKAFPADNRLWKVDWFGDLLPNPNAKSEPLLEAFIVPYRRSETSEELLRQRGSYDYTQIRKISVGVSLLPFLHLGTFWRGGIHQTAALSERIVLRNLRIDHTAARIVNAENFEASDELLTSFPAMGSCPKTSFFEIDFPEKPAKKILVPCYEVVRFYFAGSSNLTRSIITGGVRAVPNRLFDETQTKLNAATGSANLILRGKLAGTDRHTVARLAFSESANNAAWGIYSSIIKNLSNTGRGIVEAVFPFVGNTSLQVCGKWFKKDNTWHFLVYFIESCSHPLPYKQLAWGIEGEQEVIATPEAGKKEHWINRTDDKNTDERIVGSDDEPALQALFAEAFFDGQKFTDLQNKGTETRLKDTKESDRIVHYKVATTVTEQTREISTAAGTFGNSKTQGLDIKIGEDEKPTEETEEDAPKIIPAGWELFKSILTGLEKNASTRIKILSFKNEDGGFNRFNQPEGIYFPSTVGGRTASWAFLNEERSKQRQVMLAEIKDNDKIFYLFDIEVDLSDENDRYSMLIIKNENYEILDELFWRTLLAECVKNRGKKRDSWSWNKTNRLPIRHALKEIEKYTARIKEFLVNL